MKIRKEWVVPSSIGVLSFALGAVAGYLYSQHKTKSREIIKVVTVLRDDVEAVTELDYPKMVQDLETVVEEEQTLGPDGAVHEMRDRTEGMVDQGHWIGDEGPAREQEAIQEAISEERTEEEREKIRVTMARGGMKFNVFDGHEWDYDVELPLRTRDVPYIIHRDEFFENEGDRSQSTLSYYAGDDVLCDEQETPIYDYQKVVGTLIFGKGSEDISIVYVRNEKLDAEWEIVLDHGSFQAEVLGAEIEHSYEQRDQRHSIHRFREDEE